MYPRGCPQLRVPVTDEQAALVADSARNYGLSVAQYVRKVLKLRDPAESPKRNRA
jgi:hypothetical protein